jgi:multiple sugar transport system ATP-binding protein
MALFVGSPATNVLRATVDAAGLHVAGAILPLDAARRDACIAANVTEVGIRPEDIGLVQAGQPGALNGEVYVVEPMGNETLVDIRVVDQRLTLRASRGFTASIGSAVGVTFDAADACFFDSAGSTRVHRARNKGGER